MILQNCRKCKSHQELEILYLNGRKSLEVVSCPHCGTVCDVRTSTKRSFQALSERLDSIWDNGF